MAAEDHLSPEQFNAHPDEFGFLKSRDYPGRIRDIEFAPGGESDQRVNAIMETARTHGIQEPLDVVRGSGESYLSDGHHRYVAARRLGIQIPIRERHL